MSYFDPKTKFLVLGDKPLDDVIDRYKESDQYKSYSKYLNKGIDEDIRKVLIPELNKLLDENNDTFCINESDFDIKKVTEFRNFTNNTVMLNLTQIGAVIPEKAGSGKLFSIKNKKLNAFNLLDLPYMDESGIIYRKGKRYVLINSLSLQDNITFDGSKLKYVDNSNSLVITGSVNPRVEMFKNKVTAIDFAVMLAKHQYGVDKGIEYSKRFINSLRNPSIIASIAGTEKDHSIFGEDTFEFSVEQLTGILNDQESINFNFDNKMDEGYFSSNTTRRYLNKLLSFNNALGRIISEDIILSDGKTIAVEGDLVTKGLVSRLNKNHIDTIYVKSEMNMVGQLVAKTIFLGDKIIKGTPVIPEMIRLIPELKGYTTVPQDYELNKNETLFIGENRPITEELCSYLEYVGKDYIEYKDKESSKKILKAYFSEEYINNRHFPVVDLEIEVEDIDEEYNINDYVYIDEYGDIRSESDTITCHDIVALLSLYMKLMSGRHHDLISDPDAGLRKEVNQCENYFHEAFQYATTQFIKKGGNALKRRATDLTFYDNPDKMNLTFKYFSDNFWTYMYSVLKVIDMLDITNPVSTMSSLTKVNTIVKGSNSISDSMRGLSMGHYGRICPYETPQSKKLGIVNNMALGCTIEDGVMYTEYYKLIHDKGKTFIDKSTKVKMRVEEEENYRIADITSLHVDKETNEINTDGKIPARVPSTGLLEKTTFALIDLKDVQYVSVSPNQHGSIACSTIPYAGGDDATRVSFGLSMVKQAKGLVNGEIPIVCTTGFMNIPNMNTFYKIFAEKSGRVESVESTRIVVLYDGDTKTTTYKFEPITLSTDTAVVRVVEVVKGDRITKGQTLLSSNYVKEGTMVIGTNALVAYMTDGFNYEDGVPVGERLSDKLTSYGVHTDEFKISRDSLSPNVQDIRYQDYLSKDDVMFVKRENLGVVGNYSHTVMRSHRCRGYITGYELVRDIYNHKKVKEIKVQSVSFDELQESDKICNRHGNKGVTCKIHKNSEMPYLSNGEFIDIKYNPNGIVSRMNIGQTLEASIGLACYVLGIKLLCGSFNSPKTKDVNMLLAYTVDLANTDDCEKVFLEYSELPEELHDHCRVNINKIRHWKGTFNKEGKAYLIDPVSGKRTLTKVVIGINYVYKLIQEGESKMHSRGGMLTASYVEKTQSPPKGASKGGGQRMGYMELDAMAGYGASAMLEEIMNERGDNYIARNNKTVKVIHSGESEYLIDDKQSIRRSTEYMLELFKALGLESEMTNGELDLDNPDKRIRYKKKAILDASFQGDEEEKDVESRFFDAFKKLKGGK